MASASYLTVVEGAPQPRDLTAGDIFRELADQLDELLPRLRDGDRATGHLHDLARLFRVRATPPPAPRRPLGSPQSVASR